MLTWLIDNIATILISLALAAAIAGIILVMIRNKKKGKSSCGCGSCSGCAMSGSCHPAENNRAEKNEDKK